MDKKALTLAGVFYFTLMGTNFIFAADETPPTVPGQPQVLYQEPDAHFTWQASTDDVQVAGYSVFRNGTLVANTTGLEFWDRRIAPNTLFHYTVQAYDASANTSDAASADLQTADTSDGLIAWWDFNEAFGNTATDRGTLGCDGLLTDGPGRGTDGNRTYITFDGVNDRIQKLPSGPLLYAGGGGRTFALWIWADPRDTDGGYVLCKPWNGNGDYNYWLAQFPDGRLRWSLQNSGITTSISITAGHWHHVAVGIENAGAMALYLDGQPAGTGTVGNTWTINHGDDRVSLCLGSLYPYGSGWSGNTAYSWQGRLDDLRVYSRAFTADEIRQEYDRGKSAAGYPIVTLLSPLSSDIITNQIHLSAEAHDAAGIACVTFMADGQFLAAGTGAPYEVTLPTPLANGLYRFTAAARNTVGRITESSPVLVKVLHGAGVTAQPVDPFNSCPVLPGTWPPKNMALHPLRITAAPDEYEPASFVLRSDNQDYENVGIEVTDLSGPGGVLPRERVDVRLVKVWYQSSYSSYGKSFPVGDTYTASTYLTLTPELLLKDESLVRVDQVAKTNSLRVNRGSGDEWVLVSVPNSFNASCFKVADFPFKDSDSLQPFSLPKQVTQQVWLTVHPPADAKPGLYSGDITIRSGSSELTRLGLQVKVPAFTLADYAAGIYYTSRLNPANATLGNGPKTEAQMRAEMLNMWAHGVKDFTLYQGLELLENVLKLRRDLGLSRPELYTVVSASSSISTLNSTVPQLVNLAHAYGYQDAFLYGRDEAQGTTLTAQLESWVRVHELGGKIFVAGYNDGFELTGNTLDVQVHAGRPSPEYAAQWHSVGHRVYCYGYPQSGLENPLPFRRNYGCVLWAANFDKAFTWAYQAVRGNQWNDIDADSPPAPEKTSLYGEENFTYSTADGVIDTIAWEAYREAVDDVRYLKTLEQAVASAQADSSEVVRQTAAQAQAYLDGLRTMVLEVSRVKYGLTADPQLDPKAAREDVIRWIEAIQAETQRQAYWNAMPGRRIIAFPNPAAHGQVTFRWREAANQRVDISVYNVAGRKVADLNTGQPKQTELAWDVRGIASGVYLYRAVLTDEHGAAQKLGVQKLGIVH